MWLQPLGGTMVRPRRLLFLSYVLLFGLLSGCNNFLGGDGHTSSWLGPHSRTNTAIADYLITRRTPAPGTRYGT